MMGAGTREVKSFQPIPASHHFDSALPIRPQTKIVDGLPRLRASRGIGHVACRTIRALSRHIGTYLGFYLLFFI